MKYVTGALAVLAIALCLALAVRVDRLQRRLDAYPAARSWATRRR